MILINEYINPPFSLYAMMMRILSAALVICCLFLTQSPCGATDGGACLFCHKYPGLVTYESRDRLKALHINEEQYAQSPHGKASCKDCHVDIVKVPHTGITGVTCFTDTCHQQDKATIATDSATLRVLHQAEQSHIVSLEENSSCRVCHPLYPHSENNVVRAFLNMHTGFMLCEVCHIKRDTFATLTYEWDDSGTPVFSGKPYGSYYTPQSKRTRATEGSLSRITVFVANEGTKPLASSEDVSASREFLENETRMDQEEKKKQLDYFHRQTARKEISVACHECHSEQTILDYRKLGFDEKKTKDLMYLNIRGLVTKYKTFYFPNLFGH